MVVGRLLSYWISVTFGGELLKFWRVPGVEVYEINSFPVLEAISHITRKNWKSVIFFCVVSWSRMTTSKFGVSFFGFLGQVVSIEIPKWHRYGSHLPQLPEFLWGESTQRLSVPWMVLFLCTDFSHLNDKWK